MLSLALKTILNNKQIEFKSFIHDIQYTVEMQLTQLSDIQAFMFKGDVDRQGRGKNQASARSTNRPSYVTKETLITIDIERAQHEYLFSRDLSNSEK